MSIPADTLDPDIVEEKLKFELNLVEDDGSVNARLTNLLVSRCAEPDLSIWEEFDFSSDWYRAEVKICDVLCQNFTLAEHQFASKDEWERCRNLALMGRNKVLDLIKQVNEEPAAVSGSEEEKKQKQREILVSRIDKARTQWKMSAWLLMVLESNGQINRYPTGVRCEDRINVMQWHLLIYRNGLDMASDMRNMTISHVQNMAARFKLKDGDRAAKAKTIVTSPSPGSGTGTPTKKPRKIREGQKEFSKRLREDYECERYAGSERWCPVTQDWIPAKQTIAAHIVPYSLGDRLANQIFGGGISLMDSRNGLCLHEDVEDAFDNAQLVILPRQRGDGAIIARSFEAVILDNKLVDQTYGDKGQYSWNDIRNRELNFRPKVLHRPARRFLYFHLLFAAVRLSLKPQPGWADNLAHLLCQPAFPSNGDFLQRGILMNIAKVIGNPTVEQRLVDFIPAESPHTEEGCLVFEPNANVGLDEASQEILGIMAVGFDPDESSSSGDSES